ncbi:MAG: 4Fe-4S dicluster domain-containing protein, partial [Actinobacteria bacterium]|nr:4Fe-4S dicluster domain-containing protein [Actinomycetota bacterium]
AMYKDADGTVQHDDATCIGCQTCVKVCPYGAPQYMEDDGIVQKCDTCSALRAGGMSTVCVSACPMRAIDFGEMDKLRAKYGEGLVSELPCTEPSSTTSPNLLIKANTAALRDDFTEIVL